jgi:hypothetical protein
VVDGRHLCESGDDGARCGREVFCGGVSCE